MAKTKRSYCVVDHRIPGQPVIHKGLKKRAVKKLCVKLGLGSLMMATSETKNGSDRSWGCAACKTQPAAPMLKNGKRMNYQSYWYNYIDKGQFQTRLNKEDILDYSSPEDVV